MKNLDESKKKELDSVQWRAVVCSRFGTQGLLGTPLLLSFGV